MLPRYLVHLTLLAGLRVWSASFTVEAPNADEACLAAESQALAEGLCDESYADRALRLA